MPRPRDPYRDFLQTVALSLVSTGMLGLAMLGLLALMLGGAEASVARLLHPWLGGTPLWDWYDHGVAEAVALGVGVYCTALVPVGWAIGRGSAPARLAGAVLMAVAVVGHVAAGVLLHLAGLATVASFPGFFEALPWVFPLFVVLNVGSIGASCLLFAWVGWRLARPGRGAVPGTAT